MRSPFSGSNTAAAARRPGIHNCAEAGLAIAGGRDFAGTQPDSEDMAFWVHQAASFEFTQSRFPFDDEDGDTFAAIILASLPTVGSLVLGDTPITAAGLEIDFADIARLKWLAPTGIVGPNVASFQFQVVDSTGAIDMSPATMTLGVIASPLGSDKTIHVHSNAVYSFTEDDFGFSDVQGHLFLGIFVDAIPDGSTLTLGNRVLSIGDFVLRSDFSQLVWTPGGGPHIEYELEFTVVNDNHTPGVGEDNTDGWQNVLTFIVADTPPTGEDKTITLAEDGSHPFSPSDFGFDDADGDAFATVVITSIAGKGRLLLNETAVGAGQAIAAADIGQLTWKPDMDANGQALGAVRFRVVDSSQTANASLTENVITFNVTPVAETFTGTNGHDRMAGTDDGDMFYGLAGNDRINGARGADVMRGGSGNDTYVVDHANDRTIEIAGQGIDSVTSATAWTLAAHVENLTLLGTKALKGTGNAQKNTLTGNAGANSLSGLADNDILKGMGGRDVLNGGAGADRLYGGAQADSFVFDARLSAANRDMIMDFSARDDTILLENGIFRKLKAGKLSKDNFKLSTETRDGDDYIIYNQAKGALYYDADGSGRGTAIQFATIASHAKLTAADFVVV